MSRYGPRIAALERQALRDRRALTEIDSEDDPAVVDPSPYLREGAGRAILLYVDARTGEQFVHLSPAEFEALERALNHWLECYARCHGVELDATFSVREAAELLLDTRNIDDVAQLLTGVPPRVSHS
ncbi:hypothetical protein SAMN04487967_1861 [Natronorubrum sediminis]|uniref:DUF8055 domain-containing protein n=1 Tax=Natronorubrum sediminis TaxID=640943 RepID=A0A1H6FW03_9EURY|nr:hypothetical protein [Natronorubrum sediminis]SEH14981.1 hypothetical protein SAMN04487967_1861 [Natronorubrum sediminis]